MKKLVLFLAFVAFPGCFPVFMPNQSSESTNELILALMRQQQETKTPPVNQMSIDGSTLMNMSPEQLKALVEMQKVGAEAAKNTPKNTLDLKSTTNATAESTTKHRREANLLVKGLGALVCLLAAWLALNWVKQSRTGRALIDRADGAGDYILSQIGALEQKIKESHDENQTSQYHRAIARLQRDYQECQRQAKKK